MLWNYDYDDATGYRYLFGRDVTRIVEIKKKNQSNELSLLQLVNEVDIGIIKFGVDGAIHFSNQTALDMLGFDHQDQIRFSVFDQAWQQVDQHEHDLSLAADPLTLAIQTGMPIRKAFSSMLHPLTHQRIWISVDAVLKIDEAGYPDHVICTLTDITQKKKTPIIYWSSTMNYHCKKS